MTAVRQHDFPRSDRIGAAVTPISMEVETSASTSHVPTNEGRKSVGPRLLARLRAELVAFFSTPVPDRYKAETRSVQLSETLQLVKYSAATHIAVATAIFCMFAATAQYRYVLALFVAVSVVSVGVIGAIHFRQKMCVTEASVDVGLKLAAVLASLIGIAWGTMPAVLFPLSDANHQLICIATCAGLIADVYALGPTMLVCMMYLAPLVLGTFIGVNLSGHALGIPLSALLMVYALFVVFSSKGLNRLSVRRLVDRARISEQSDTIGLLLREFEENASDWLWDIDEAGNFAHVSDRVAQAAGLEIEALEGRPFRTMLDNPHRRADWTGGAAGVLAAIEAGKAFHDQIVEIDVADGRLFWRLTGKPISDKSGRFVGFRGVGSDITAARNAAARIDFMARHDELTGLVNRSTFVEAARLRCAALAGSGSSSALLYLDLDGFKKVNDSNGHAFGDDLLRHASRRLVEAAPNGAVVGRLGGDEFAVMFELSKELSAELAAQTIIDAVSAPYPIRGSNITIGVSIGIALAPRDAETPDILLVRADLALYRAKMEGRGLYRMFVEAYERSIIDRRALEDDLRLAMSLGEFQLNYMPLVSLSDGRITCFEALIRWRSEKRGAISPADFIPVAESIGLIVTIGQWVLSRACRVASTWRRDINVAVNISPQHFKRLDFVNDVLVALETSGLEPTRLEIEITEGVFLDSSETAIANLHALRRRGIRIALDDFGTGFSSLNYLVNFPVDKIKIDRSFITDFVGRLQNRAIVNAILTLAKDLSIMVTAEGVETVEQAMALKSQHCDEIQGFLVSAARPAADLAGIMAATGSAWGIAPERDIPTLSKAHLG